MWWPTTTGGYVQLAARCWRMWVRRRILWVHRNTLSRVSMVRPCGGTGVREEEEMAVGWMEKTSLRPLVSTCLQLQEE